MALETNMDRPGIQDALLQLIDEMSPDTFFRYAMFKMVSMNAEEKDLRLLECVAYKTDDLMQRIKKKSHAQDLRANMQHMDSPIIPGLTLMEQSPVSSSILRGQFREEARNESRYFGDSIPSTMSNQYYNENCHRFTYR